MNWNMYYGVDLSSKFNWERRVYWYFWKQSVVISICILDNQEKLIEGRKKKILTSAVQRLPVLLWDQRSSWTCNIFKILKLGHAQENNGNKNESKSIVLTIPYLLNYEDSWITRRKKLEKTMSTFMASWKKLKYISLNNLYFQVCQN